MNRKFVFAALALVASVTCIAQPNSKSHGESEVTITGKTIAVKYQGEAAKGRTIFGGLDAVLQPNMVWRAGVGNPTTLHTSAALQFDGSGGGKLDVPAGEYTLFVLVGPKNWQLIVSKETGAGANVYHKEDDLGRVPMTMAAPEASVETMRISVTRARGNAGRLSLEWGNAGASIPFTVK